MDVLSFFFYFITGTIIGAVLGFIAGLILIEDH